MSSRGVLLSVACLNVIVDSHSGGLGPLGLSNHMRRGERGIRGEGKLCVCVCVCVCEREREGGQRNKQTQRKRDCVPPLQVLNQLTDFNKT